MTQSLGPALVSSELSDHTQSLSDFSTEPYFSEVSDPAPRDPNFTSLKKQRLSFAISSKLVEKFDDASYEPETDDSLRSESDYENDSVSSEVNKKQVGQLRGNLRRFLHNGNLSPLFDFLQEQVPSSELFYIDHNCRYTGRLLFNFNEAPFGSYEPYPESEGTLVYEHGIVLTGYFGPNSQANAISKRCFQIYHFDVQTREDTTRDKWIVDCNRLGEIKILGVPRQILPLRARINLSLDSGETMVGHIKNGMLVGDILVKYPGGNIYKGRLGSGSLPHGDGMMWFKEQRQIYSGEFVKSCRDGYGELCNVAKGSTGAEKDIKIVYKGLWRLDVFHGRGIYRSPEGHLYEGNFINGARQGKGSQWFNYRVEKDGTATWDAFYTGEWSRTHFLDRDGRGIKAVGRRHGRGVMYSEKSGVIYHGGWFNGKKHDLSGNAIFYIPKSISPCKDGDRIFLGYYVKYRHGELIYKKAMSGYTMDPMTEPVFSDDMKSAESYDIYSTSSSK